MSGSKAADVEWTDGVTEPSARPTERHLSRARGYRYIDAPSPTLTEAHEEVFLNMRLRKMDRQGHGPREKGGKWHLVLLAICLALALSAGHIADGSVSAKTVTLSYGDVAIIAVWLFAVAIVVSMIGNRPYKTLLYWMIIYLPMVAIVVALAAFGDQLRDEPWVGWTLLICEVTALLLFVCIVVLYPKFIRSKWLRKKLGIHKWWSLRLVSDWTMVYKGRTGLCRKGQTCKYEGDIDETTGLPHGSGRWFDDSYMGEIISGQWHDGKPVAPFVSRMYGTGDSFEAVRIGFFSGTDDTFATPKVWPTNELPPRVGVASVECSVEGNFYGHLPSATEIFGPTVVGEGEDESSVEEMLRQLVCLDRHKDGTRKELTNIGISADDPKGLQIRGHSYATTGSTYSREPDQIVIDVKRADSKAGTKDDQKAEMNFMPAFHDTGDIRRPSIFDNFFPFLPDTGARGSVMVRIPEGEELSSLLEESDSGEEVADGECTKPRIAGLEIRDWKRTNMKAALVFFPGYNCPLQWASETLGQFCAMSGLAAHVYPIIYAWPCSVVYNPRAASAAAATKKNRENVLELVKGLKAAGVDNIHFMSHSMGVQTLLAIFEDKEDGSRSDLSAFFRLDPAFDNDDLVSKGVETVGDGSLNCRSITMINPDFPLDSFKDRAFVSVRRVCSQVTVVGDREDVALQYLSKMGNWICNNVLKMQQPDLLVPGGKTNSERGIYRVLGCDFDRLYFPDDANSGQDEESGQKAPPLNEALLFKDTPPLVLSTADEKAQERRYFDMDVIDVTSLDTNIAGIRHGGFNLNAILLRDLEELIRFGRRASKRSNLIYREGNVYSYAHAPAHVAI